MTEVKTVKPVSVSIIRINNGYVVEPNWPYPYSNTPLDRVVVEELVPIAGAVTLEERLGRAIIQVLAMSQEVKEK